MKKFLAVISWAAIACFAQEAGVINTPAVPLQPLHPYQAEEWKHNSHTAKDQSQKKLAPSIEEYSYGQISAMFALGLDGTRRYFPSLSVVNTSREAVEVLFEFLGTDGKPLEVPFRDPNGRLTGYYSYAAGIIPPGAEAGPMLVMDTTDRVKVGYVRILADDPAKLHFSNFLTIASGTRFGVITHRSIEATFLPQELLVENNHSTKQTVVSIVNPGKEAVTLLLEARGLDGNPACEAIELTLEAGQQIWRAVQNLMSRCVRQGSSNYLLRIEPLDGELAVQAYYDYSNFIFATALVHEVEVFDEEGTAFGLQAPPAVSASKGVAQKAAACAPQFDPLRPRLTAGEQELEVEVFVEDCLPDQRWLLVKTARWFHLVDSRGREVSQLAGQGDMAFTVRIDEATATRRGGSRTGYIYLYSFNNGRRGKILARYSFTQPIPKL
jgi:hypothetical protein